MSPRPPTIASYAHAAQVAAAQQRRAGKAPRVTPRMRAAIDAMVHEGLSRREAAELAGLTDAAVRVALTKSHVLAYLNEQKEVLRTSAQPRAIRRIVDLVDSADTDRVRLDAARYLDGLDRPTHSIGGTQVNVQVNNQVNVETPGYVIKLQRRAPREPENL